MFVVWLYKTQCQTFFAMSYSRRFNTIKLKIDRNIGAATLAAINKDRIMQARDQKWAWSQNISVYFRPSLSYFLDPPLDSKRQFAFLTMSRSLWVISGPSLKL